MPITVRLPEDLEKRLDKLAKLTGRTKTYYVREALEARLEELEDLYIAEHRLEHPEGPPWSLEQIEKGEDQTSRRTGVDSWVWDRARKELRKLDPDTQQRILKWLRQRIAGQDDPRRFGKALKGRIKGLWRYRVGSWRIICQLQDENRIVLVVRIGHRRDIYE